MTEGDRGRFATLIYWLAKRMLTRDGKPVQVEQVLLLDWFRALRDIRIERLEWGAQHLFATTKWFPMPVDLRAAAMLAPSSVLPVAPVDRQLAEEPVVDPAAAEVARMAFFNLARQAVPACCSTVQ